MWGAECNPQVVHAWSPYKQVWVYDTEFYAPDGHFPRVLCLVAKELKSGDIIRLWEDDLCQLPPFDVGSDNLFIAYYASAEIGCHFQLGWAPPTHLIDMYTEFRVATNGLFAERGKKAKAGLLDALHYYGLAGIDQQAKDDMRELAKRGGFYTLKERKDLLHYCQSDVEELASLVHTMAPGIDVPRALWRGQYSIAEARIIRTGIPMDVPALSLIRHHRLEIMERFVNDIDSQYGVYDGTKLNKERFAQYLYDQGIQWPTNQEDPSKLCLQYKTFKEMARVYPRLEPLKVLRRTLSNLKHEQIAIGPDDRNRTLLSIFGAITGRNTTSGNKQPLGLAKWWRCLIKPPPGYGLAYIDWSQQEFAIAAALSNDTAMQNAYASTDPYLDFAQRAGLIPPGGTKAQYGVRGASGGKYTVRE